MMPCSGAAAPDVIDKLFANAPQDRPGPIGAGRFLHLPTGGAKVGQPIEGTGGATCRHLQHMRIDHRGTHIAVAEQLLHGANVGTRLQQVCRERMAQRMH